MGTGKSLVGRGRGRGYSCPCCAYAKWEDKNSKLYDPGRYAIVHADSASQVGRVQCLMQSSTLFNWGIPEDGVKNIEGGNGKSPPGRGVSVRVDAYAEWEDKSSKLYDRGEYAIANTDHTSQVGCAQCILSV